MNQQQIIINKRTIGFRKYDPNGINYTTKRRPCIYSVYSPLVTVTGGCQRLFKRIREKQLPEIFEQNKKSVTDMSSGSVILPQLSSWPLLFGRYRYVQLIGKGGFSQTILAEDMCQSQYNTDNNDKKKSCSKRFVAIKIMNTKYAVFGEEESIKLRQLNNSDKNDSAGILRLYNTFYFQEHFCLVFELLGASLLTKAQVPTTGNRLSIDDLKKIAIQLIASICFLRSQGIIHADLKPENILFKQRNNVDNQQHLGVKIVDFGNAINYRRGGAKAYYTKFTCQTLSYRAPEVVFGLPFHYAIDMWSLGAVLVEIFIGRPLFQCTNTLSLIDAMQYLLGPIPHKLFSSGKLYSNYFTDPVSQQPAPYTPQQVHFRLYTKLQISHGHFLSFIQGLLTYDPEERMTPQQALLHPFLASIFPFGSLLQFSPLPTSDLSQKENSVLPSQSSDRQISPVTQILKPAKTYFPVVTTAASPSISLSQRYDVTPKSEYSYSQNTPSASPIHQHSQFSQQSPYIKEEQPSPVVPLRRDFPVQRSQQIQHPKSPVTSLKRPYSDLETAHSAHSIPHDTKRMRTDSSYSLGQHQQQQMRDKYVIPPPGHHDHHQTYTTEGPTSPLYRPRQQVLQQEQTTTRTTLLRTVEERRDYTDPTPTTNYASRTAPYDTYNHRKYTTNRR
jgi:serine/threonine protein kinase